METKLFLELHENFRAPKKVRVSTGPRKFQGSKKNFGVLQSSKDSEVFKCSKKKKSRVFQSSKKISGSPGFQNNFGVFQCSKKFQGFLVLQKNPGFSSAPKRTPGLLEIPWFPVRKQISRFSRVQENSRVFHGFKAFQDFPGLQENFRLSSAPKKKQLRVSRASRKFQGFPGLHENSDFSSAPRKLPSFQSSKKTSGFPGL